MKKLLILFLLLYNVSFSQEIPVKGFASIVLNNRKDIENVKNIAYKNKLINDAIKNAINQSISYTIQFDEKSEVYYDEINDVAKDDICFKTTGDLIVKWRISGVPHIYKDYVIKNKWNCNINGYVIELKRKPKPIIKETKNINIIIPPPTIKQNKYVGRSGRQR